MYDCSLSAAALSSRLIEGVLISILSSPTACSISPFVISMILFLIKHKINAWVAKEQIYRRNFVQKEDCTNFG